jgi:hypothetical protein
VLGDVFHPGHAVQPGTANDGQGGIRVHRIPDLREDFRLLYPKIKSSRKDIENTKGLTGHEGNS